MCCSTGKDTACRSVHACFRPELLQALAAKGLTEEEEEEEEEEEVILLFVSLSFSRCDPIVKSSRAGCWRAAVHCKLCKRAVHPQEKGNNPRVWKVLD